MQGWCSHHVAAGSGRLLPGGTKHRGALLNPSACLSCEIVSFLFVEICCVGEKEGPGSSNDPITPDLSGPQQYMSSKRQTPNACQRLSRGAVTVVRKSACHPVDHLGLSFSQRHRNPTAPSICQLSQRFSRCSGICTRTLIPKSIVSY